MERVPPCYAFTLSLAQARQTGEGSIHPFFDTPVEAIRQGSQQGTAYPTRMGKSCHRLPVSMLSWAPTHGRVLRGGYMRTARMKHSSFDRCGAHSG